MSMMTANETVTGNMSGSGGAMTILPPLLQPTFHDESNHRVANSLQLVAAMVALEMRDIGDAATRAMLEAVQRRILAIAGVHRQLYGMPDSAMIDMAAYLFDLGHMLEQSCGDVAAGRRVIVRADELNLPAQHANAIGIIMSELVGNACKYAYAYGMPGNVRVTLLRDHVGSGYRLEIEDRGRGMSAFGQPEGTGLGHRLIAMMAERLDATQIWEDAQPGTRFVLIAGKAG